MIIFLNRQISVTVSQLTYHEEWCGEIEADEVDPQVDAQSESGDCCHGGREVAQKTEPRFAAHPVGHHARHDREQAHYDERAGEIRHDRLRVSLELQLEGPRGESRGANVLKHTSVLGSADDFQKSLLPSGAANSTNRKQIRLLPKAILRNIPKTYETLDIV